MAMTSSRSSGTIDLNDTGMPETKKPQDTSDPCGFVVETIWQSFLLAIACLPAVVFAFQQENFQ